MQLAPDTIDFSKLPREAIAKVLNTHHLNLTVDEILTIQETLLKRPPTLAECVLWSIQGSEHCSYKSSRPHLKQFNTTGPHVILGAKEDAGIVEIAKDEEGRRYGVVISHESHNHPSQIVPYEGAATGVGGNVRDVSCMGAEVIAIADALRFGDISRAKTHWLQEGIVRGIGGYGNPLGIPNIGGDVYYDEAYNENCLVTVVTLGIVREDHIIHSYAPPEATDNVFILVGKPTDNSGFGGASFASATLEEADVARNKGAVQEPNAFLQRHLLKANNALFRYLQETKQITRVGFKDLGAGGVACASVELAEAGGYGADIDLDLVPTSMKDLPPYVVLCSETQERFMWVVPPDLVDTILKHYNETFALPQVSEGARAAVIGRIRKDGMYVVNSQGQQIVNAKAKDITQGIVYNRPYTTKSSVCKEPVLTIPTDLTATLQAVLKHENVASRHSIFETYDKQVQGRSLVEAGMADAGVLQPFNEERYPQSIRQVGVALSLDQHPRFNKIDAYWGAVNAVLESIRNVVCVGAMPIAITDCLCFGNPEKPEQMGELVDAIRGICDACSAVTLLEHPEATLPVIAGNVSLYNDSPLGPIPPSPMISCVGKLSEVDKVITFDFKQAGSALILIGERKNECGGSIYYQLHNVLGAFLPKPDLKMFNQEIHAVHAAMQAGFILAAHDISDGGIAAALAEMSFKNKIGVKVEIPGDLSIEKKLFSETGGFVLEVAREKLSALKALFHSFEVSIIEIGHTTKEPVLRINNAISLNIDDAKFAWENGLTDKLL